jgi:cytoskeletal protein RodZ
MIFGLAGFFIWILVIENSNPPTSTSIISDDVKPSSTAQSQPTAVDIEIPILPSDAPIESSAIVKKDVFKQDTHLPSGSSTDTQPQMQETLSDIPGDTNNDGVLSGEEQYLRDNS